MTSPDQLPVVAPPHLATVLFGDRLDLAVAYHDSLATHGVERGLIGPREVPRLWSRHLNNSALLAGLPTSVLAVGASVCDVGSGAGLPGIPLALARPDLCITLLEPSQRRATYLTETVAELGLRSQVHVERGRAEDGMVRAEIGTFDVVVSRALAPLPRLFDWCEPLTAPAGFVVAVKGRSAGDEVAALTPAVRARWRSIQVVRCGLDGVLSSASDEADPATDDVVTGVLAQLDCRPTPRSGRAQRRAVR